MFDDLNFTVKIMVSLTRYLLRQANCEQPHPLCKADDQTPDDDIFLSPTTLSNWNSPIPCKQDAQKLPFTNMTTHHHYNPFKLKFIPH